MVCKYSVEIYTTLFISHNSIFTSPTGVAVKYCGEYVSVSVCVSVQQDGYLWNHVQSLPYFLCMLPVSMAQSSGTLNPTHSHSDTLMIGRVAYRWEEVVGVHSMGEV